MRTRMKKSLLLLLTLVAATQEKDLDAGLVAEYFAGGGDAFPAASQKPVFVRVDKNVDYPEVGGDFYGTRLTENFQARWTGILRVEKAGRTQFWTESDDGSRLTIDGKVVVDNPGQHPMTEKTGAAELSAGDHEVKIEYFQGGGGAGIQVYWQPPAGTKLAIPAKAFYHKKGAEKIEWDEAAWKKRKESKSQAAPKKGAGKFAMMDHGPFA